MSLLSCIFGGLYVFAYEARFFYEASFRRLQNYVHFHDRVGPVAMVLGDNVLTFAGRTERHHAAADHARDADFFSAVAALRECR